MTEGERLAIRGASTDHPCEKCGATVGEIASEGRATGVLWCWNHPCPTKKSDVMVWMLPADVERLR